MHAFIPFIYEKTEKEVTVPLYAEIPAPQPLEEEEEKEEERVAVIEVL